MAKKKKKSVNMSKKMWGAILVAVLLIVSSVFVVSYMDKYEGKEQWIYIEKGYSEKQLQDTLTTKLGDDFGEKVCRIWSMMGGDILESSGAYKVEPGITAWQVGRNMAKNYQSPITVTFNNVRTMEQLAQRMSKKMKFDENGKKKEQ